MSVGRNVGVTVDGECEGLTQAETSSNIRRSVARSPGRSVAQSVAKPATSYAGDCVDPGVSNNIVLQQRTSQVMDTSRVDTRTVTAGGFGVSRPMRTKRSRSRSRTPPRQYRERRRRRKTDREMSPYRRNPGIVKNPSIVGGGLVYLALCEPDAPAHDLARHRDNTENAAGGISRSWKVTILW